MEIKLKVLKNVSYNKTNKVDKAYAICTDDTHHNIVQLRKTKIFIP